MDKEFKTEMDRFMDSLGDDLLKDEATRDVLYNFAFGRPKYYHRDGSPIVSNDLLPDTLQWAALFEHTDRHVATTTTFYGERLSTVYLGLEHGFVDGKPLIFETMLFAPEEPAALSRWRGMWTTLTPEERRAEEEREAFIKKHYPHDQLQIRYATESEASDRHEKLRLQCLIPPRWRHFLLWTIAGDRDWAFNEDEEDTWT